MSNAERDVAHRIRIEVTRHAIRWTSNILAEVLSNHGKVLPDQMRNSILAAISALAEVDRDNPEA